jgi:probable F420-dependent oxidoreductase
MKIGISMFDTDRAMPPTDIAREVESRGFDSLFLPEHSHIPTSRRTPWPGARPGHDDPLPDYYSHLHDQIVALSMAGAVTRNIQLGTAVTLLPQHDPIWLAKQVASLDALTEGRVVLGIGYGWNVEQGESHGTAFNQRRQRTEDCVGIMKALWSDDVASYEGTQISLEPAWAYPKPAQPGGPPIIVGGMGPRTYRAIARYADGWMPITGRDSVTDRLQPLREAYAEAGRDPDSIRVFIMGAAEDPAKLANLHREGVEHACLTIWSEDADEIRHKLDEFQALIERARRMF